MLQERDLRGKINFPGGGKLKRTSDGRTMRKSSVIPVPTATDALVDRPHSSAGSSVSESI